METDLTDIDYVYTLCIILHLYLCKNVNSENKVWKEAHQTFNTGFLWKEEGSWKGLE